MNSTSYEATVVNGQIRLPENLRLPEHAKVTVIVQSDAQVLPTRIASPKLMHPEQASDFQMVVQESANAGV
jgi:hypothetical protein